MRVTILSDMAGAQMRYRGDVCDVPNHDAARMILAGAALPFDPSGYAGPSQRVKMSRTVMRDGGSRYPAGLTLLLTRDEAKYLLDIFAAEAVPEPAAATTPAA